MRNDASRTDTDGVVDVVIIGTGCGGAPIAARLAQAGLSVVALEAGRRWLPKQYAQDESAQRELYWLDERLSDGNAPVNFGRNNSGCGVGGSSLHYGAYAPRPDRRDLRIQSEFGVGRDWPIDFAELVSYLREAETFLGVSGPATYPWDSTRNYQLPPLPLNAPAQLMERGCDRCDIKTAPAPILALSKPKTHGVGAVRHACANCGFCHQGCFNGAKASMDVTYLPIAEKFGVDIRPECFAHQFERDGSGAIRAVVYRHKHQDVVQRCRAVFLCAGAIETPRLLLHTRMANSSGQVGRNFMVHMASQVWGTFEQDIRPSKGFPASLITEDMVRPAGVNFAGGYLVQSLGIVPVTWASQVARARKLWGQSLVQYLHEYNHVAGIGINGECLPHPDNFLELSDELDERGFRKPLVHFSYHDNERRLNRHADQTLRQIWTAAGGRDLWTCDRTAHTIGTCRMGTDRSDAVVDLFGKSFDVPNLWISDHSTFPSALSANPALTLVAMALRTADEFLR